MDNITILDGAQLVALQEYLSTFKKGEIHTVRINQREGGVSYKINGGMWSPTIGRRADAGGY